MSSGAGKSGKPCERLTAPCLSASRVISRITDSVKRAAFFETWRPAGVGAGNVITQTPLRTDLSTRSEILSHAHETQQFRPRAPKPSAVKHGTRAALDVEGRARPSGSAQMSTNNKVVN
jgi:hypothetical protein